MMRPQEPHSRSTLETQASFSNSVSPNSSACSFRCGASSQKTQVRLCLERCSRLSKVTPTTRRDTPTSKPPNTSPTRIGGCDPRPEGGYPERDGFYTRPGTNPPVAAHLRSFP